MRPLLGMAAYASAACALSLGPGCVVSRAQPTAEAPDRPQLSVAPIPTAADPSPGTPQVTWSTGNGSQGDVTMASDRMKETAVAFGSEGLKPVPAMSVGQLYVFRLYSIDSNQRRLLARLTVGRGEPLDVVALAPAPKATAPAINRVLQLLPFAWMIIFAVLGGLYLRERWHYG
ncbi:MAG: hypothetical protein ACRDLF_05870 [Solirubrobacteraceae bacterium]